MPGLQCFLYSEPSKMKKKQIHFSSNSNSSLRYKTSLAKGLREHGVQHWEFGSEMGHCNGRVLRQTSGLSRCPQSDLSGSML